MLKPKCRPSYDIQGTAGKMSRRPTTLVVSKYLCYAKQPKANTKGIQMGTAVIAALDICQINNST